MCPVAKSWRGVTLKCRHRYRLLEDTMAQPKIGIIVGTTRTGRFADRPAQWLLDVTRSHGGVAAEIVDLRDYPMPFFDEPGSPMWLPPTNDVAVRWGQRLADFDGFIFITAEYNHGIPGVLKNALDYAYAQFGRKPAAFVGYGAVGAARAIEQLRLNAIEFHIAPLRHAVHIGMMEFVGMLREGKDFADYPHLERAARVMLDDLLWWANTLKAGREAA
jgi:NAD(P)H-dependent FMN reductase